MKRILLWGLLCLAACGLQAQSLIDTWGLTTDVDEDMWIDLGDSYQTLIAGSNTTAARSEVTPIGFPFMLGATVHTSFSTNINGTVRLGSTPIATYGSYTQPLGTQHSNGPKIEPFGCRGRFDNTCYTRMAIFGTQGEQVTVIETRLKCYSSQADSAYMSFQVQLFEAGGLRIVYGPSDEGALRTTMQNGVVAATGANRDIIFIDFTSHEASRFAGNDGYCTLTNSVWPEEGRWYMLTPDSNACPRPSTVSAASTDPTNVRLQRGDRMADLLLLIPEMDIDTIWPMTSNYMELGGGFNPRTTYTGTVQSVCNGGHISYRTFSFQFITGCGPVSYLPWTEVFNNSCWNTNQATAPENRWQSYSAAMRCNPNQAGDYNEWLISPIINLPDDDGLTLRWKYKSTGDTTTPPTVDVRIAPCDSNGTVDSTDWVTLMTLDSIYGSNFIEFAERLYDWRGLQVKLAFVRTGSGRGACSVDDVTIQQELEPVIEMEVPQTTIINDTTVLKGHISGIDEGTTWEWYSTLLDSWSADSGQWAIVYPEEGFDTVTLIVSNSYGADTATAVIRVADCHTQIPWEENFETTGTTTYSDCWNIYRSTHINGTPTLMDEDGVQQSYSSLMSCSANGYITSPKIVIPATGGEHLKVWVECNARNMAVKLSPNASADPNDFTDTLIHVINDNSTGTNPMRWYLADLAPYAGDTVRIGIFNMATTGFYLNTVKVDYDLLPVLDTIAGPYAMVSTTEGIYSIALRRGATNGLTYTWSSTLGQINSNITGDTTNVSYYTGGIDTITVIATNDFGADTATKIVNVIECNTITELPWIETFVDGAYCWYFPTGSDWRYHGGSTNPRNTYLSLLVNSSNSNNESWVVSPEIAVPTDTNECVRLFWEVTNSVNINTPFHYEVMVSTHPDYTDLWWYQTVYEDSVLHQSTNDMTRYDYRSVDLSDYAGQNIYIAFRNLPLGDQIGASASQSLYIIQTEVRSAKVPVIGSIEVPGDIYTEDGSFHAVAVINEGNRNGMTYTWHSSLMNSTVTLTVDSLPLSYNQSGIDTLTLIVSNIYGADTAYTIVHVHHCSSFGLPFIEPFNSDSTLTCWRMWNFDPDNDWGRWHFESLSGTSNYVMTAGTYYNNANAWLISPEIDIPAGTNGLNLRLKAYGNSVEPHLSYLTILVSTTGPGDTTHFTDTLVHDVVWPEWATISESLNSYAGQSIRLAFVLTGVTYSSRAIYIDSLSIDYEYQPRATVRHYRALVGVPSLYTAKLNNCVNTGLTYTWHSTMLDTTIITPSASLYDTLSVVYNAVGTDTMTLIASNAYGADTVTTVVEVIDCLITALPYTENFEEVSATAWNTVGQMPDCWSNIWEGSNGFAAPHVITTGGCPFGHIINIPSNALLLLAGDGSTGYANNAYVTLPYFAEDIHNLSIALDYCKENPSRGTLEIGYMDGLGNYNTVKELVIPIDGTYQRDTISFDTIRANNAQIAIRWSNGGSFFCATVDNISVYNSTTEGLSPLVTLVAPETVYTYDTVTYTATLQGDTTGLTYTWHSSLLDTTITSQIPSINLVYTANGVDTISVTVVNIYGSSIDRAFVNVSKCHHVPYYEDFEETTPYGYLSDGSIAGYNLPSCWQCPWFNNWWFTVTGVYYEFHGDNNSKKLRLIAGSRLADTINYVVLPELEYSIDQLSIALDYVDSRYGTLSVGYVVGAQYTPIYNLPDVGGINGRTAMVRDTVSFSGITVPDAQIAICYHNTSTEEDWDRIYVDNIEVFHDTSSHADTTWYTVEVTTDAVDACELYGSGRYMCGDSVEIGYRPAGTTPLGGHWQFLGWNDGPLDNPRIITVTSDTTIVAQFHWVADSTEGIDPVDTRITYVTIYPNPASNTVIVKTKNSKPLLISMTDIHGRTVETLNRTSQHGATIDVSRLATGTYFLRVTTESGSEVKKLIIR